MATILMLLLMCSILSLGLYSISKKRKLHTEARNFILEYRDEFMDFSKDYISQFVAYGNDADINSAKYTWLTLNCTKAQKIIGKHGIVDYMLPYNRGLIKNYHLIVDTLPKFRNSMAIAFEINSVNDSVLRYVGDVDELLRENLKELKNPFIWFKEGVR